MIKPRVYYEAKAIRSLEHKNILTGKLIRSLKKRTDKEKFLDKEIKAIENAQVIINCTKCGKPITLTFSEWQNGRFKRACRDCKAKQNEKERDELCVKLISVIPDDFVLLRDGHNNLLIQRKNERV
jgi:hypothetical protein